MGPMMSVKCIYAPGNTLSLRPAHYLHLRPHLLHPPYELFPDFHPLAMGEYPRQSLPQVQFLTIQSRVRVFDEVRLLGLSNPTAFSAWADRRRSPVPWHHRQLA